MRHFVLLLIVLLSAVGSRAQTELLPEAAEQAQGILDVISPTKVFWSILFLVVGYLFIKMVARTLDALAERSTNFRITLKSLTPVVTILMWVMLFVIIIIGILQPPMETVLAASASIAIAVGLAAQDVLKNIFAGILILFDRPFTAGDKIETGSFYGEVVQIGLRSTRIVTPDDSLVTIPNTELMNAAVSNSNGGEPNCQVVAEIYLPMHVDTEQVRQIAAESAKVSRFIYLNKPIAVLFFNELKDQKPFIKMRLKAYVSDIRDEFKFKSDMTEIVLKALYEQKIIGPEDYR